MFYWGRILGGNPDNGLTSLPSCHSQSSLQMSISSNSLNLLRISSNSRNLLHISTVQLLYTRKENPGKPERKSHPLPYGLRNPHRNLKSLQIMPRNLNENERSWIRLLYSGSGWTELERPASLRTDSKRRPTTHWLRGRKQEQETFVFQKDLLLRFIVFNLTLKSFFKIWNS